MLARILSVLIVLLGITQTSTAQVNLDSLFSIWNDTSQHDTTRLEAMSFIANDGYGRKDPDSSFYYAQLQFDFAESTGQQKWQAEALRIQAHSFQLRGNFDQALLYIDQALTFFEEARDTLGIANTLATKGGIFLYQSNFDEALQILSQSLELFKNLEDKNGMASCLNGIGTIYAQKGAYVQALDNLDQGRKLSEELGNTSQEMTALNSIGVIYLRQGEDSLALERFFQVLEASEEIGDKRGKAGSMSNIGDIYNKQGNSEKALEYFTGSLEIAEEIGLTRGVIGLLNNLGDIYRDLGDNQKAFEVITRSIRIAEETGAGNQTALQNIQLSYLYAAQNDFPNALSHGHQALELGRDFGEVQTTRSAANSLYKIYKMMGDYQASLEMYELHIQMRDSLANEENQRAILQQQFQYDYEKQKALDDAENQKLIAIETQKKENQQKLTIAIGIGLALISFLAIAIFNRLKVTRQQKEIIEEQKKQVEQSEKYKEQFLANMSHEIRTPMHAISGMVKILERNKHPKSQDVYLNAMQQSSENLVVILNDVLDLSKIEAGKLDIENIPIEPNRIIDHVVQILQFKAEEKGITLHSTIAKDIPPIVMGDPTRLNQILINLVGNAIKFTEKGIVKLGLSKVGDNLQFSIQDTGIGISQDKLETIFGAFEQAQHSTSRSYGGTGLGLSISKQLVELQGGEISVTSKEGQGSTFLVELPIVLAAEGVKSQDLLTEEKLKSMAASLQGIRILLAEDNEFNQMIARDDLSYYLEDVHIDIVENGVNAVEAFQSGNYDLILMDVQMPELNGFEATQKIRKIEQTSGTNNPISIIAMTASLLKSEIDNCYLAGMNNYIPKPYKADELVGTIFTSLKGSLN